MLRTPLGTEPQPGIGVKGGMHDAMRQVQGPRACVLAYGVREDWGTVWLSAVPGGIDAAAAYYFCTPWGR